MKLLRSSFIFLFFISGAQAAEVKAELTPAGAKSHSGSTANAEVSESEKVPVELEWETIPGAKLYELEFKNMEGKTLSVFKSPNHIFKFKFKVGKYRVRSRVADVRKVYGEWSALTEFAVQPRPVKLPEKPVTTNGVIDPKTLSSEVAWTWAPAVGAKQFRVKVMDANNKVVRDELVQGLSYKTSLPAGVYTTVLTSVGNDGIESEPVTLPGKVTIETAQLAKPVIALEEAVDPANPKEKITSLPLTKGVPTLRLKDPSALTDTVGTLEYRYFFGEEWIPVDKFTSKNAKEVILDKALKPGRYRITAWSESAGLKKSEATSYEFVVKPTKYSE